MEKIKTYNSFFRLLSFGVAGLIIWYFQDLVLYFLLALILSYVLKPLSSSFKSITIKGKTLAAGTAAALSFVVLFIAVFGFLGLLVPVMGAQFKNLSSIDPNQIVASLEVPIQLAEDYLIKNGLTQKGYGFLEQDLVAYVQKLLDLSRIGGVFQSFGNLAGNVLMTLFSVFFMGFFLLRDEDLLQSFFKALLPQKYHAAIETAFENADNLLRRYFLGILLQIVLIAILIALGMYFLGVPNALFIGVFAGLINLIPYLGPILGMAFGLFLGITANLDMDFYTQLLPLLGKMALVFIAVQLIDNIFFQPFIFAKSVHAHPIEIYLIILVGAQLAGAVGMFLAIPIYTMLRVAVQAGYKQFNQMQ